MLANDDTLSTCLCRDVGSVCSAAGASRLAAGGKPRHRDGYEHAVHGVAAQSPRLHRQTIIRRHPSNNMEIAFGTDTGTMGILLVGDGELSPDECDLIVGWDCGSWFVEADENVRAGERFSAQVTPQGTSMRLR